MPVISAVRSTMPTFIGTELQDSTRRHFCALLLLSSVGLVACRSGRGAEKAVSFNDFLNSLNRVADREPTLPGVQSLVGMRVTMSEIAKGLSAEDISILNGALYLDAEVRLRAATLGTSRGLNEADIREACSRSFDTSRYDREFVAATIRNARSRMATDAAYGLQVAEAAQTASNRPCRTLCQILVWSAIILVGVLYETGHI